MEVRKITVDGFEVDVINFGNISYFYPSFNGNAEFKVNSTGYKELRRYLRTIRWASGLLA